MTEDTTPKGLPKRRGILSYYPNPHIERLRGSDPKSGSSKKSKRTIEVKDDSSSDSSLTKHGERALNAVIKMLAGTDTTSGDQTITTTKPPVKPVKKSELGRVPQLARAKPVKIRPRPIKKNRPSRPTASTAPLLPASLRSAKPSPVPTTTKSPRKGAKKLPLPATATPHKTPAVPVTDIIKPKAIKVVDTIDESELARNRVAWHTIQTPVICFCIIAIAITLGLVLTDPRFDLWIIGIYAAIAILFKLNSLVSFGAGIALIVLIPLATILKLPYVADMAAMYSFLVLCVGSVCSARETRNQADTAA